MKKRRVALVLAGGGARGVAHIGAIEELERQGFEISAVAGTSMGALVGGVYASGYLEPFKEWMRALDKYKVFSLVDFALSTEGLVKGDRVMEAMKELVPDVQIERMPVPFAAVAADLLTGDEVVLDSGGLYDAIRASISIPSVFRPVHRDGRVLVDGGTVNPLPLNRVRREEGDLLGDKSTCGIFDNTKIKRLVPDFVCTVPFAEGVRRSVAYFEAHPELKTIDEEWNRSIDAIIEADRRFHP